MADNELKYLQIVSKTFYSRENLVISLVQNADSQLHDYEKLLHPVYPVHCVYIRVTARGKTYFKG